VKILGLQYEVESRQKSYYEGHDGVALRGAWVWLDSDIAFFRTIIEALGESIAEFSTLKEYVQAPSASFLLLITPLFLGSVYCRFSKKGVENHTSKNPLMKFCGSLAVGSSSALKYFRICGNCFQ